MFTAALQILQKGRKHSAPSNENTLSYSQNSWHGSTMCFTVLLLCRCHGGEHDTPCNEAGGHVAAASIREHG
jgi:hypothetical protein